MIAIALLNIRKGRIFSTGLSVVLALVAAILYVKVGQLPGQFVTMTPYLVTLLVLGLGTQRLRMPAADGAPYRRGGAK